jgi:hypothetical protein
VNTHTEYIRHNQPPQMPHPETEPGTTPDPSTFALYGDSSLHPSLHPFLPPSLQSSLQPGRPGLVTPTGRRIAWVRPTELHSFTGALVGRGIDLHSDLARRASRTPQALARTARRATRDVLQHRSTRPGLTEEGLQL